MQDFKKLEAWRLSFEFGKKIYSITKSFPKEEVYSLTSQLRRVALSISANIAEGTDRSTDGDFLRFLHISMGSLRECENFILMSRDFKYLSYKQFIELISDIKIIGAKLGGLIRAVQQNVGKR